MKMIENVRRIENLGIKKNSCFRSCMSSWENEKMEE